MDSHISDRSSLLYRIAFRMGTETYPLQGPRSGFSSGGGGGANANL